MFLVLLTLGGCANTSTKYGVSFEEVTSFGPPGDGFLKFVDWPTREFHFVRVVLCPEPADAMCRVLRHDVYRFDEDAREAAKISSRVIDKEDLGNAYPDTEQKMIEIGDFLRASDNNYLKTWEMFVVCDILEIEVQYRIRWHSLDPYLQVRSAAGDFIETIDYGLGTLHRLYHFPGTDGWTYIFLDGRSCGASACAGYVHVYRARKNE